MSKPLVLNKKDATSMINQFFALKKTTDKAKMWDSVFPYINAYPDIYNNYLAEKHKEREAKAKENMDKFLEQRKNRNKRGASNVKTN